MNASDTGAHCTVAPLLPREWPTPPVKACEALEKKRAPSAKADAAMKKPSSAKALSQKGEATTHSSTVGSAEDSVALQSKQLRQAAREGVVETVGQTPQIGSKAAEVAAAWKKSSDERHQERLRAKIDQAKSKLKEEADARLAHLEGSRFFALSEGEDELADEPSDEEGHGDQRRPETDPRRQKPPAKEAKAGARTRASKTRGQRGRCTGCPAAAPRVEKQEAAPGKQRLAAAAALWRTLLELQHARRKSTCLRWRQTTPSCPRVEAVPQEAAPNGAAEAPAPRGEEAEPTGAEEAQAMTVIFAKCPAGETMAINVTLASTVGEVMNKISNRLGLPTNELWATYAGKLLAPGCAIREHNIQELSTLQLSGRLQGGVRNEVVNIAGEEVARLEVEPTASLVEVRAALRESIGWRRAYAKVLYGSMELSAGVSLQDIGITEGAKLTLVSLPPVRIALQPRAGVLELRDSDTGACVGSLNVGGVFWGGRLSLAFSPNGQHVLPARRSTVELWCVSSGQRLHELRGHEDSITSATFSPDGRQCLTASEDGTARLWSAATGDCLRTLRGHGDRVCSAAFSPDGLHCLTASEDGDARLWQTQTGECARTLRSDGGAICSAIFSPGGHQILTGCEDGAARLWSAAAGDRELALRGHEGPVWCVAFSPTGLQALTGSLDRTARLWSVATGECSHVLRGHAGDVFTTAFSPDCLLCLTASSDNTAKVWNAAGGECLRTLATWRAVAAFLPETLDLRTQAGDEAAARQQQEDVDHDQ